MMSRDPKGAVRQEGRLS